MTALPAPGGLGVTNPYYADYAPDGMTAAVWQLFDTDTAVLMWLLVGHTSLGVAQYVAAEMNAMPVKAAN
jgi:hypothetical protein